MNLLLDTHIFLWYISSDPRLPSKIAQAIQHSENRVYLSVISLWESLIKNQLGKLTFPEVPERWLPLKRKRHLIDSLELDEASIRHLVNLPDLHRDPFDRILICQAIEHRLKLVTVDKVVARYPVEIFNTDI